MSCNTWLSLVTQRHSPWRCYSAMSRCQNWKPVIKCIKKLKNSNCGLFAWILLLPFSSVSVLPHFPNSTFVCVYLSDTFKDRITVWGQVNLSSPTGLWWLMEKTNEFSLYRKKQYALMDCASLWRYPIKLLVRGELIYVLCVIGWSLSIDPYCFLV